MTPSVKHKFLFQFCVSVTGCIFDNAIFDTSNSTNFNAHYYRKTWIFFSIVKIPFPQKRIIMTHQTLRLSQSCIPMHLELINHQLIWFLAKKEQEFFARLRGYNYTGIANWERMWFCVRLQCLAMLQNPAKLFLPSSSSLSFHFLQT